MKYKNAIRLLNSKFLYHKNIANLEKPNNAISQATIDKAKEIIPELKSEIEMLQKESLELNREEVGKKVNEFCYRDCNRKVDLINKILSLTPVGFEKVASGELHVDDDNEVYINIAQYGYIGASYSLGHKNSSPFKKYANNKKYDIYIKESEGNK